MSDSSEILTRRSTSIQFSPNAARDYTSEGSTEAEDAALITSKKSSKSQLTLFVVVLSCVSTIGGFLFGYDTGVVSGALIKLKVNVLIFKFMLINFFEPG